VDARDFFLAVIPWASGGYCSVHWIVPKEKGFFGRSYAILDELLEAIDGLKAQRINLYYCMTRQRLNAGQRSKQNALEAQSLYSDIDIGKEGRYQTKIEAICAVYAFCDHFKIPYPSAIVDSGGGVHCYWFSDRALPIDRWQPYADGFKAAAKAWGLKADLQVTADAARVLRIPDTINYNYDPPRKVYLIANACNGRRIDFALELAALLESKPAEPELGNPDDLLAGISFAGKLPLDFDAIKKGCAWLREVHDTGGKEEPEPLWHDAIRCCTHLSNGDVYAHEFGNQHPDYDAQDTTAKYARAFQDTQAKNLGWPHCRTIHEHGCKHCDSCAHFKFKKSPLHLGMPSKELESIKLIEELGGTVPPQLFLPEGFGIEDGKLCAYMQPKKQNGAAYLLRLLLNKVHSPSLQRQHGESGIGLIVETEMGAEKQIFISGKDMWADSLPGKLAAQLVLVNPKREVPQQLTKLGVNWLDRLRAVQTAVSDSGTLGWRHEKGKTDPIGFVYGDKFYRVDGRALAVPAQGDDEFRRWYEPTGSKEPWLAAAKLLTDRKRPELDILISVGFAAPLMPFNGNLYGGILSVWGEPGTAKSCAQQVAAAIYGHPKQTRESLSSTSKSVQGRLGRIRNLAAYWDDIQTEMGQEHLLQTMFVATEGAEGGRLAPDSSYKERKEWQTFLVACSNASFAEFLLHKQKETTAGLRRVLEFPFNKDPDEPGMIDEFDANKIFGALNHNYGRIGEDYIKLITSKYKTVEKQVETVIRRFKEAVGGKPDESYWWGMIGVLIAGAQLGCELGAELDPQRMEAFLADAFLKNRHMRKHEGTEGGTAAHTEAGLSMFFNHFAGMEQALYTDTLFNHKETPIRIIYQPMNGRPPMFQVAVNDRKILIPKRTLRDYLREKGLTSRGVLEGLIRYYNGKSVKVTLGGGTRYGQMQEHCYEIAVADDSELSELLCAHGQPGAIVTGIVS